MTWNELKEILQSRSLELYNPENVIKLISDEESRNGWDDDYSNSINGEIFLNFSKDFPSLSEEDASYEGILFASGLVTNDGYLHDQHTFGFIEELLFKELIDCGLYESQTMEAYSALHLDSNKIVGFPSSFKERKKELSEIVSIVFGNSMSDPNAKVYSKVSTKNCTDAIEEKYGEKNVKRTAKFNFGKIVVREFNEQYTVLEYNNRIISVLNYGLEQF